MSVAVLLAVAAFSAVLLAIAAFLMLRMSDKDVVIAARFEAARGVWITKTDDELRSILFGLERSGEITHRPLSDDATDVLLVLQRRRSAPANNAISDLHDLFVAEARRTRGADSIIPPVADAA